ncbi:hypothetical protein SteCoe_27138 [Stentor coeruleus]|uniref:Uncharacterized protein n=1 Tax=Stentor coeruleus TaxID=5963 RepID=A0A1R2BB43_9CILI|nr:hypothetical protein SteCoe_27138 [Stentor coeruleus]
MKDNTWNMYPSTSEESDSKSFLCAPKPTKQCFTYPRVLIEQQDTDMEKLQQIYKEQHASYSMTFRSEVMIRRIIQFSSAPREYLGYPLIKLIVETACEMMMSEVEIAGFCIYLNRFIWPINTNHLIVLLYTVAFGVKYYFSNNMDPLLAHICSKIPNFLQVINFWINRNEEDLKIDFSELNRTFEKLIKQPYNDLQTNYNFYVDLILEMAPASVYEKPTWKLPDIMPDDLIAEMMPLPTISNLGSVFNDLPAMPYIERWRSTASVSSVFVTLPDFNNI